MLQLSQTLLTTTSPLVRIRDYNSEAEGFIGTLDNHFVMEQTTMYTENAPVNKDVTKEKLDKADESIATLTCDARKAQYEADQLALARDVAQIGALYKEVVKTEAAIRTERITHLRGQNCIGASVVADHMNANMAVYSGTPQEQLNLADRVRFLENLNLVLIWLNSV